MSFKDYFNLKKWIPSHNNPTVRNTMDSDYMKFMRYYGFALRDNKTISDREALQLALTNPYVTACIESIAESMVGNGFIIKSTDDTHGDIDSNQVYLEQLFSNPEGLLMDETYNSFFLKISRSLSIYGEAFVEILEQPKTNQLSGFRFIPSDLLLYNEKEDIWYFKNHPDILYDSSEIIHIMNPSITYENRFRGESPINKITLAIKSMTSVMSHNNNIFSNPGLDVNHVLSFDKDISNESYEQQLELLGEMSRARQSGGMIALKGAQFSNLDQTKDLDYKELLEICRDIILSVYRVPPAKVGIIESGNLGGGTGESQDKTFKDMINGKSKLVEDSFNKVLLRYGYDYTFEFNEIDLEDKQKRAQTEQILINAGILTPNEVREGYELEPLPGGDDLVFNHVQNDIKSLDNYELDKRLLNDLYTNNTLSWSNYK